MYASVALATLLICLSLHNADTHAQAETIPQSERPALEKTGGKSDKRGQNVDRMATHGSERRFAFIQMRGIGMALIYLNGKKMAKVFNWAAVAVLKIFLSHGDVIAVSARGIPSRSVYYHKTSRFGIVVDIRYGAQRIRTGVDDFRAVRAYDNVHWTRRGFEPACRWPRARNIKSVPNSKASFVWAKGVASGHSVYIRYVMGGQKCPGGKNKQKEKNKGGNRDADSSRKRCRCKQMLSAKQGWCFFFNGNMKPKRRSLAYLCTRRKCFPKYECVGNEQEGSHQCIRKFVRREVKPVRQWVANRFICRFATVNPPREFLVPYE